MKLKTLLTSQKDYPICQIIQQTATWTIGLKMSWRDFIKFLEATGAALTLPSLVPLGKAFGVNGR